MIALQSIFTKKFLFISIIALVAFNTESNAQNEKNDQSAREQNIAALIDARSYYFKAQSVNPTRGRLIQLTSEYELKVSRDTLRSFLPYFGRAYSAPLGGRSGGIDFTSKDFEYNQKSRRKGGWDITIRPKDITDVREMFLVVFDNGSASLRVSSNNRDPISYNGYISEK